MDDFCPLSVDDFYLSAVERIIHALNLHISMGKTRFSHLKKILKKIKDIYIFYMYEFFNEDQQAIEKIEFTVTK